MRSTIVPVAFLAFAACAALAAQQQPAAPRGRTVWDGAYTDEQADRGQIVFDGKCANCHTLGAEPSRGAGQGGGLSNEKFWTNFTQRSVGDLLAFVKKNMPNGQAAGSLPAAQYNDVVALILRANGFPAGSKEVAPDTAADIQIIPKDGPGELPANALARVVGCLTRDGADWVVTHATTPERIDKVGAGPNDATRPLGNRTVPLKFVLGRIDRLMDQRVAVSGTLIGLGGVGGINVSDVTGVSKDCQQQ
jgi:mono/diheme cytochrome c family protein